MIRKSRPDDHLRIITDRVFYKWRMLAFIEHALTQCETQEHENVYIESGVVHARALIHFLFADMDIHNVRKDDAIAKDFFPDQSEWSPVLPDCLSYSNFGVIADKQIAHLGYVDDGRWKNHPVTDGSFDWDFKEIMDAFQPVLEEFIRRVSIEKIGNRWMDFEDRTGIRWDSLKRLMREKHKTTI